MSTTNTTQETGEFLEYSLAKFELFLHNPILFKSKGPILFCRKNPQRQ